MLIATVLMRVVQRSLKKKVRNDLIFSTLFLFVLAVFSQGLGAIHHVTVENFRFDVDDNDMTQIDTLAVSLMDTVQWDWVEGFHTVTSGLSSDPGDNPGALFDTPSDQSNTTFQYQFTEEGDVPYFCRPHEGLDMKGVIRVEGGAGIDDETVGSDVRLPAVFSLSQNYPNPFNPVTTITFQIASAGDSPAGSQEVHRVSLEVYDLRGRKVRTLIRNVLPAGGRSVVWDGRSDTGEVLGSGAYIYRLRVDGDAVSKKMILAR